MRGPRATIDAMHAGSLSFTPLEDGRVLAGVAGGFARQHGAHRYVVRGALVVLAFAAGLGIVLYALGAVVARPDSRGLPPAQPHDARRDASVACITFGVLMVVRTTGLWLGDGVMVPLMIVVVGVVVLALVRTDVGPAAAHVVSAGQTNGHPRARLFVGAALIATGLLVAGAANRSVSSTVRVGVVATALSVVGIAVVLGPWIAGLVQSATEERRQRIRAQEREAVAAHLHDSVLQTLALIQRTADDPRRTASLARQQEHELRAWLYGDDVRAAGSFAAAIEAVGRDVEQLYDVRVEMVVVGDVVIDAPLAALVAATREACVNAAKHSGESRIAVYAEARDDAVEVFVRDRGVGFDRADTGVDRRGIAGSIESRMVAAGGTAVIDSEPGAGTEVQLQLPRAHVGGGVPS